MASSRHEHGVAELVRAVFIAVEHRAHAPEHYVIGKRAQQLVVALGRLMRSADDGVDHAQRRLRPDPLSRKPGPRAKTVRSRCGMLQRPRHRRAQGDDAPASSTGFGDRRDRGLRNVVRLIERKSTVQVFVTGRRNPRGMRQCAEADSTCVELFEKGPVEREGRRRRLERGEQPRHRRPRVPYGHGSLDVSVLDRPAMPDDAAPDIPWGSHEAQGDQPRVVEQADDRGM